MKPLSVSSISFKGLIFLLSHSDYRGKKSEYDMSSSGLTWTSVGLDPSGELVSKTGDKILSSELRRAE